MAERKFLNNSANWRALDVRPPGHPFRWTYLVAALAMALGTFLPVGGLANTVHATGTVNHTSLVPWTPRLDTPRVDTGAIEDIVQWGDRILLAGTFTEAIDNDTTVVDQPYLLAYDIDTGAIDTTFTPEIDGAVLTMAVSPDGQSLYIGGQFNTVNGDTRRKIAKIGPDGSTVTAFVAQADSRVSTIAVSNDAVYVGGFFAAINGVLRGKLAAVDPNSGAVDTDFDIPVTEGLGSGGLLKVHDLLLTPDGNRLVVVHSGRRVDGEIRTGAAVINTASKTLDAWSTGLYEDNLSRVGGVIRINAADISPDGSYFVVVSGSGGDRPPISDTAVAFPVAGGAGTEPLWVSRMFDSLFSVGISEVAVYVGGHFRWQEAPGSTDPYPGDPDVNYGWDSGLGAYSLGDEVVRRDQIGAIDPATGKAMNWDPGSDAAVGVQVLEPIERGLLVFHDGTRIGGRAVGQHAFFDFDDASEPAGTPTSEITSPISGVTIAAVPTTFSGTAYAPNGVNRVRVIVRNASATQYLQDDGTVGPTYNDFDADLASPGSVNTGWSTEITVPNSGSYEFVTRTYQVTGNAEPSTSQALIKFEVDASPDLPPETDITQPSRSEPPTSTTFTLAGTAADDLGVASIRIVVQNSDTNEYLQDDFTAGPDFHTFSAETVDPPGGQVVNWSQELTVPYGRWTIRANAIDTSGQLDNGYVTTRVTLSEEEVTNLPPELQVQAPLPGEIVPANAPVTISGVATDVDGSVTEVQLRITNEQTTEGVASNGTFGVAPGYTPATVTGPDADGVYSWSFTTPSLPPGSYSISARAYDDLDSRSDTERGSFIAQVPGDAPPETVFDQASDEPDQNIESLIVHLSGTATDDIGVARVAVTIQESYSLEFFQARRYLTPAGNLSSAYTEIPAVISGPEGARTWTLDLTLPQEGDYTITAKAVDTAGQYDIDQSDASTRWIIWPGDTDPYTTLTEPTTGSTFPVGPLILGGRAFDNTVVCQPGFTCGIERVDILMQNEAGFYATSRGGLSTRTSWVEAFLTNPGGQFSNWSFTTPSLPDGTWTIRARATDLRFQIDQVSDVAPQPGDLHDTITVVVGSGVSAIGPTAVISTPSCSRLECSFDGSGSMPSGDITSWTWDFGDGNTGDGATVSHTYATSGTYTVELTVTDSGALSNTTSVAVTVSTSGAIQAVVPGRVLETRSGPKDKTVDGQFQGIGARGAGTTTELTVAGRAGVPSDAASVMLNVTAVTPAAAGYLTVYPCGTTKPLASNVNYVAGQVVPNAVLVKIGTAGKVCIFTSAATHIVADVNGYVK